MHKDDSRDGDENDAAGQNEQDGGRHSDLGLADLFVFLLWKNKQAMPLEQIQANYKRASKYSELTKGPKVLTLSKTNRICLHMPMKVVNMDKKNSN